jgi:hypothetical protein
MKWFLISAAFLVTVEILVVLVFVYSVDCRRRRREKKKLYLITGRRA